MLNKLKKILLLSLIGLTVVAYISYKAVDYFGWSRIESKLVSQGTIKSTINEIESAGWNIRTVSWIDAHGRYCTTIFTNEKGVDIDCDFK